MSQSISSISYSPASPTPTDTIYFYVDLTFLSGGCPLSNAANSTVGNTVFASSLHCVGMLTVICNITDTFMVLPLPVGNYTFDMTLSSGAGPVPCSPGIMPDDNRVENFVVAIPANVKENNARSLIEIAPNPSNGIFKISKLNNASLVVYDVLGNRLIYQPNLTKNYTLDLSAYPKGMYLLKIASEEVSETHRLLKK